MPSDVTLVIDEAALQQFFHGDDVAEGLLAEADPVITAAQAAAPKRTGEGAESIHGEIDREGGELAIRVSWDRAHYYMVFHEVGTRYLPARPFLAAGIN